MDDQPTVARTGTRRTSLPLTAALLLASYHRGVRYTRIGAMLNGPRKRPGKIPGTKAANA